MLRRIVPFLVALVLFAVIHEGAHAVIAHALDEYETMLVHPYGLEVIYRSPVEARVGAHWAYISGVSNFLTLAIGYVLFAFRKRLSDVGGEFARATAYYALVLFMLVDAFNLSVGPLVYGGDIHGIVLGLGVSRIVVQTAFLLVLLINRELLIHRVLPLFGVQTGHILFRPLLRVRAS